MMMKFLEDLKKKEIPVLRHLALAGIGIGLIIVLASSCGKPNEDEESSKTELKNGSPVVSFEVTEREGVAHFSVAADSEMLNEIDQSRLEIKICLHSTCELYEAIQYERDGEKISLESYGDAKIDMGILTDFEEGYQRRYIDFYDPRNLSLTDIRLKFFGTKEEVPLSFKMTAKGYKAVRSFQVPSEE